MNTLLIVTDGRADCLKRTIESFEQQVRGEFSFRRMADDSADPAYAAWLDANFTDFEIDHHPARLGFCGTVHKAWSDLPECDYVFHLEDDFIFNRPVFIQEMVNVLQHDPALAQIVLKRQPVNFAEQRAGGIVELLPDNYADKEWQGYHWLEQQMFWSTNPCLYSYRVTRLGWPKVAACEGHFGIALRESGCKFAFWGERSDAPWVEHIGHQRVGNGY